MPIGHSGPSGARRLLAQINAELRPAPEVRTAELRPETRAAVTAADGTAEVVFGPVPYGEVWLIQRITVQVTNAPGSAASVFVGPPIAANFVDGTIAGDLDVADELQPVVVPGGQILTVQWASAGVGNTATATIQYRIQ